jgi:hypothetical protein
MLASQGNFGFDAARKEYVDLVEAGIVDPAKVVRTALENAVSVASVLLLTEATMTEIPEKEGAGDRPGDGNVICAGWIRCTRICEMCRSLFADDPTQFIRLTNGCSCSVFEQRRVRPFTRFNAFYRLIVLRREFALHLDLFPL